jgi:hypothetical protein
MNRLVRWLLLIPFAIGSAMAAAMLAAFVIAVIVPEFAEAIGAGFWAALRQFMGMLDDAATSDGSLDLTGAGAIAARASALAGAIFLAPVTLTAITSEILRWRSWVVQAAGCGLITLALPLALLTPARGLTAGETRIMLALGLIGVLAGSVYWLIAGRGAARDSGATTTAPAR